MSTAGKTTDSTRLNLKIALEQIADLKIELQRQKDQENAMDTDEALDLSKGVHMDTDQTTESSDGEVEIVFSPAAEYDTPQKVTFQPTSSQSDQDESQD